MSHVWLLSTPVPRTEAEIRRRREEALEHLRNCIAYRHMVSLGLVARDGKVVDNYLSNTLPRALGPA